MSCRVNRVPTRLAVVIMLAGWAGGCASASQLANVERATPMRRPTENRGWLRVYTPLMTDNTGSDGPSLETPTYYTITFPDGKRVDHTGNANVSVAYDRPWVALPAGSYKVAVRSECAGKVTVPVEVAANRVISVHLEATCDPHVPDFDVTGLVRGANGRVIGWVEDSEGPSAERMR